DDSDGAGDIVEVRRRRQHHLVDLPQLLFRAVGLDRHRDAQLAISRRDQSSVTSLVSGATAPSTKAWISSLPKPSITFSRARRGVPPSTSTAPATSILPTSLRPAGTATGSSLVRNGMIVSSASTTPHSGSRSGLTMARRSLAHNIQAVRYEPRPSWLCSCTAEIPLECVAIRNAAQNHRVNGSLLACMMVPAVTEVCRPQAAHS